MTPSQFYSIDDRIQAWEDQGRICHYCDKKLAKPGTKAGRGTHFDHKQPQSKGGSNDWQNLALSCKRCNTDKGDAEYLEFIEKKHSVALKQCNRLAELLYEARKDPFWDDEPPIL